MEKEKAFIRIFQKIDLAELKKHLLVVGELEGSCENCQAFGISYVSVECPQCHTPFKYIASRSSFSPHQIKKIQEANPAVNIIDYSDYKKNIARKAADELFE